MNTESTGNRDSALRFITCFCTGDIDGLSQLLAEDLDVHGTLYRFTSRNDYINSLGGSLSTDADYTVIDSTGEGDSVTVFYDYIKPSQTIRIAHLFRFQDGLIREMYLVFDASTLCRE